MTRNLVSHIKELIGRDGLARIAEVRRRVGLSALCVRAISVLPSEVVAAIREGLTATGSLDYARGEIVMDLASRRQIARLRSCEKEPETVRWIEQNVRPGDVFYDVGANVGAYSFVAQCVAERRCRVYAFEPGYSTYASLCENIRLNRMSQTVVPLPVALSDVTALVEFHYRDVTPGAARHSVGNAPWFAPVHEQPAMAYRLDELIVDFGLPVPNLMKIDVDGGEARLLTGARRTLSSSELRSVLIEIDDRDCPATQIESLMGEVGLRLGAKYQRGGSERFANYVFVRHDSASVKGA